MGRISRLFFWGYALMLVGIGASGVLIAPWELDRVFAVPLATLTALDQATLLNQYRFLKALELTFGIYCISFRREIFRPGLEHRVFLIGPFAGVIARLGSWLVDGSPRTVFLLFLVLELITGVLVWLQVRQTTGQTLPEQARGHPP
ncbi:MAG: DUF4345 domain-containing protein [Pseudomonadota bacterium]|nr:DUF4345 domain-containing protein [Pseudomonadota bacterium]